MECVFADEVLKGQTYSEAYRLAYSTDSMSDSTVWSEASRVAARPCVSARLAHGWRAREERAVHSDLSLRSRVTRGLLHEAENADSDSARVAAWAHLGKASGWFGEQGEDEDGTDLAPDDLLVEIKERLRKAFNE
jgi:hypothetical protein